MSDIPLWTIMVVVLLVGITVAGIGLLVIQRLRKRGGELRAELAASPIFADDRAHNQLRLARGELDLLRREGREVPSASALLDRADEKLQRHDNLEAVRLALQAHELLVAARREEGAASSPPAAGARSEPSGSPVANEMSSPPALTRGGDLRPVAPLASAGGGGAASGEDGRPPKNRMEAHFQMTLLVEELARATPGGGTPTAAATDAELLRGQAQRAYSAGNYTEALRLALRGRRALGARLETLPPAKSPEAPPATAGRGGPAPAPSSDGTCPRCHRPFAEEDRFCRGCGASRTAGSCPRCQAPVTGDDTFCGRCGSPLA